MAAVLRKTLHQYTNHTINQIYQLVVFIFVPKVNTLVVLLWLIWYCTEQCHLK